MKRGTQMALVVGAALVGGLVAPGLDLWRESSRNDVTLAHGTLLGEPRSLPSFTLTDTANRPFGNANLMGGWMLLSFGFTHCPDVCPTTLASLVAARRLLADLPAAVQPRIALFSVDPLRDTPDALRAYVSFFDPQMIGVTGPVKEVDDFMQRLGVAVLRGKPGAEDGGYEVSHTASVFVVDPRGRLVAILSAPHTAAGVAADFRAIVAAG
jgi:protein SCO1/2